MNMKYTNLLNSLNAYRQLLNEAYNMLNEKQDEFKKLLIQQQQEKSKEDAEQI